MPVALVVRIAVIDRRVEASMEVTPVVMEMRPVVGMTISIAMAAAMEHPRRAITAATEHRRGTKAAAVDRAASEPAAAEATASTATETTTTAAAMLDFCRQPVGCKFC